MITEEINKALNEWNEKTPSAFGIFIDSGNIYVCNSGGQIYNVNVNFPYTQTLFNNSGLGIGGSLCES